MILVVFRLRLFHQTRIILISQTLLFLRSYLGSFWDCLARIVFAVGLCLITPYVYAAEQDNEPVRVRIAAIDWCPQICPNNLKKGYVVDIIESVYRETGYDLDIQFFPWSRAIKVVREGLFHALLSPAKEEAPDLIYPHLPVGQQQMCFFVNSNSSWTYNGIGSLRGLSIGMAQDSSIEELNQYRNSHPEQFQLQPYLKRFVKQNVLKMQKGRIDTFLFTKNTTFYDLAALDLTDSVKLAGCVSSANIYIAFSAFQKHEELVSTLSAIFDERMKELTSGDAFKSILNPYGIEVNL